ncbi:MAG: DUF4837 family protein, partial [Gemmatimonadota bacterium]
DKSAAFGEANSLIVFAEPALWEQLEQETYDALEPTQFTTRDERTFNVTHTSSEGGDENQLLRWKQVVVFAAPGDERLAQIADEAGVGPVAGEIIQAGDVWARGQLVTAVVLDPGNEAASWRAALPELARILDDAYRQFATSRMFVSGVDTVLARQVRERFGAALRAPIIYRGAIDEAGFIRLRNDRPDPSDRIRSVLIQRRAAADSAGGAGAPLDPEALFAWRASVDSVMYNVPQSIERVPFEPRRFDVDGAEALEVRGIWHDEGSFPAAGPFIVRAVRCPAAGGQPASTWFFDAWLYSPNARDSKYEFMLQLEEILDSFRCTSE